MRQPREGADMPVWTPSLQIIVYPMKHDVYVEHFERAVEADLDYPEMPMFSRTVCKSAAPE